MYNVSIMSTSKKLVFLASILVLGCAAGYAQSDQPSLPVDEIIRKFADTNFPKEESND